MLALMLFAVSVGAVCAFLNLPAGASTSTVSSSTSLVPAVRSGAARGTDPPRNVGRLFIAVVVEVRDAEDRLVAQVTQTQAVLAG